jgi:hypothetical protein
LLEHVYIPGLRRAGDFGTAVPLAGAGVVVHNAGDRFAVSGARVERDQLSASSIVSLLRR